MRHGRQDYDDAIQDERVFGQIPAEEPVFLIRGQDRLGAAAVEAYGNLAEAAGLDDVAKRARDHAAWMRNWPNKKAPD